MKTLTKPTYQRPTEVETKTCEYLANCELGRLSLAGCNTGMHKQCPTYTNNKKRETKIQDLGLAEVLRQETMK